METALLKEELDRLYRLYGDQARAFRRNLYVLIVAGLAVFVLLVVPFLGFRDEAARLRLVEETLVVEIAAVEERLQQTEAAATALRDLARRVESELACRLVPDCSPEALWADADRRDAEFRELRDSYRTAFDPELVAWAEGRLAVPPEDSVRYDRRLFHMIGRPCAWVTGVDHVTCSLCAGFRAEHDQIASRLAEMRGLSDDGRSALVTDLEQLVGENCEWFEGETVHPTFLEPFGESLEGSRPAFVDSAVVLHFREASARIQEEAAALQSALPRRQREIERLERSVEEVGSRLAILDANLDRIGSFNRIGTPVGDLPIGLGQLVLLFPVVLGLAFAAVAGGYRQMAATQRAFLRLCAQRDAAGAVMDAAHLRVIAPLWLERAEAPGAWVAHWAVVLAPTVLFGVTLWMIWSSRALDALLPDDAAIPAPVFVGLYGGAAALVLAGLVQIALAARGPLPKVVTDA